MMLNGLKIKNSLTLQIDLAIRFSEKSQLKRFLVSKEHLLIQVINSNHSSKLHQWTQIQHYLFNKVKSSMKTRKLLNGLDSGRLLQQLLLLDGLLSTPTKFIMLMVLPL